jgi:O-glycosyl hydrolase
MFAGTTTLAGLLLSVGSLQDTAMLTVDGGIEYQTVQGVGASFSTEGDPYPIPTEDVAAQAYALGIRTVGVGFDRYLELTNDDDDPSHFNWNQGPNSFDQQFAAADARFRLSKTLQDAGLEPVPNLGWAPDWMMKKNGDLWEFDPTIPAVYDEVAEFWAAFLLYARDHYGVNYPYISFPHEPDNVSTSTAWKPSEIRDAIERVGARLATEHLTAGVISPNCCLISTSQTYLQTILAGASASSYLSAAAYRAYDSADLDALPALMRAFAGDTLIGASGLPIWVTEWSPQYDKRIEAYIETLRYALDLAKFLHYCYAEGRCSVVHAAAGVTLAYGKDVGAFGPGLGPGGLRLKKFGHAMGQYSRFIQPGSRRIDAGVSGASNLFVVACKHPTTGTLTIVMLNHSTSEVSVTANLSHISAPASMRCVRTSATEDSTELGRISLADGSFTVALPAESITTCVGSTLPDDSAPSVPTGVSATALSDTLARLTWSASTDNVEVAEYRVFRDGVQIGITPGTSYVDHGLKGQTSYSYTVLAFDLAGNESARCDPVYVTALRDTMPPAVPAHLAATPRPNAITLTWDLSTDSVSDHDLSSFRVYTASAPGGPYNLLADLRDPAVTSCEDAFLLNGQTRYYVVTSYDDAEPSNESAYSSEANSTPNPRLFGGLRGNYYDSAYVTQGETQLWDWFNALKTSRTDAVVDFNWETVTPPAGRYITGLYGTTYHWCLFGARWQGEILADQSEIYTFETLNLDGARLWVDGKLIIDDWAGWFTHTNDGSLALTSGWHPIRLDYYRYHPEAGEGGVIRLYYSSPSVSKHIIPADHLATVGMPRGDLDRDYDIDQEDFGRFQACYSGSNEHFGPGCEGADLDGDGDVDQSDSTVLQRCISGPEVPADPNCAK